ncbi:CDC27 family protein [Seonamhaeicola sp. ML3]|uniref:tetratricopeptide repeat protein n=1 Tax=Seonamhaeicola sp. ML3 TaxID=2937786 RepID=UPI0020101333|nr:CDC27 family protein [Seonamhaeicola sp. ML3]
MEDKNYILFESYLTGEISPEEVTAFELRLETEPEFNQAFNTYKELSSFLGNKFENEEDSVAFEANLKNISEKHFNKDEAVSESKSKPKVFKLFKYAIAASIVLLFGIFTFQQFSTPAYSDFADHDTISLMMRGEQNSKLKDAENAFNSKEFENALALFNEIYKDDTSNSEIQYYIAITLIETNQYNKAEELLEILRKSNSAYKHKATWYLALSKLKQKEYDACLEILRAIPEDADDYEVAQRLIKKLD